MTAYQRLTDRFARIATVNEASSVLLWDAAVMMPPGGAAARGDQLAVLASTAHALLTDRHVADDLADAEAATGLADDPWRLENLRLMRHAHTRAVALPADLVEARTRSNSACETVWRDARRDADFGRVRPYLVTMVRLVRETASALSEALDVSPYDALIDGYQRGIGEADVEPVFAAYERFLHHALPRAEALQASRPAPHAPQGPFPITIQATVCRQLAAAAGLDFDHARLDSSIHPFCRGMTSDVRITTRYDEADFAKSLLSVLHETGHAVYERHLPTAFARQPVGQAAGAAAHESQALIVEMQACRSDAYLTWLGPVLHRHFGGDTLPYEPENLGRLWRRVSRGCIRVGADELTYPAHVILRFRLERALIAGSLDVADLPGAWNEAMRALLGVVPANDALGCLQDIHWYDGGYGYFPNYTLGAMAAAQLMAAARGATPDLDDALGHGDLSPLRDWLRTHVHGSGSLLGFNDLLRHATGKPLDPTDFETHLSARYLS
jgi:carboxypeptidase Taq